VFAKNMQAESVCQAGKGLGRWKGKGGLQRREKEVRQKGNKKPACLFPDRPVKCTSAKRNALD